ncbi:MAG: hypothetical protein ACRDTD_16895, partial [Pseudonocardiaceae bacterium]
MLEGPNVHYGLGDSSPDRPAGPAQVTFKVPKDRALYQARARLRPASGTANAPLPTDEPFVSFDDCIAVRLRPVLPSGRSVDWGVVDLCPSYAVSNPVAALQVVPHELALPDISTPVAMRAVSSGEAGQELSLPLFPVADSPDPVTVTVTPQDHQTQTWTRVGSFATATSSDPYYVLDAPSSRIVFGPAVGTGAGARQCGRIPGKGADITVRVDTTRGAAGNVAAGTLTGLLLRPQPVPDAVLNTDRADYAFLGRLVAARAHGQVSGAGGAGVVSEAGGVSVPPLQPFAVQWPVLAAFSKIDAAVTAADGLWFFSGSRCVHIPALRGPEPVSSMGEGVPELISTALNLPSTPAFQPFAEGVDAAARVGNTMYLFKGRLCLAVTSPGQALTAPQQIDEVFHNLPKEFATLGLDAASTDYLQPGHLHLLRGARYVTVLCEGAPPFVCISETPGYSTALWPELTRIIPRVTVANPDAAVGGSDPELWDDLLRDTPAGLTEPHRALLSDDYERALKGAVPGLARVICRPTTADRPADFDLALYLLPVLSAGTPPSAWALTPSPPLYDAARRRLEVLRPLGTRVLLACPAFHRLRITLALTTSTPPTGHPRLREQVRSALVEAFHPLTGGPDGAGWPLDSVPSLDDVHAALSRLPGTFPTGLTRVDDLDAPGGGISLEGVVPFLPVLDLLDLTLNGSPYCDSLILEPEWNEKTPYPAADRTMDLTLSAAQGYTWDLVPDTDQTFLHDGQWNIRPPVRLTHTENAQWVCRAVDRSRTLTGRVTYQLTGTTQRATVEWANPPAGPNSYTLSAADQATVTLSGVQRQKVPPQEGSPGGGEPVSVSGGTRIFLGNELHNGNDAHPHLAAALTSSVTRSIEITLEDTSYDKWVCDSDKTKLENCTLASTPLPPIEPSKSSRFTAQAIQYADPMSGTVLY